MLYTITRCAEVAGVVKATTHKFGRAFATWNHVLGGVSVAVLQKWLWHSDIETTMRYISTTEVRSGQVREQVAATWASSERSLGWRLLPNPVNNSKKPLGLVGHLFVRCLPVVDASEKVPDVLGRVT